MRFLLPAIATLSLGSMPVESTPREYESLLDDPELASVKTRLARGIPSDPAPLAVLPGGSPHHRANQGKK